MSQNIYDDEGFFAGYSRLGRSVQGLEGAAEWPAICAMLPDLKDSRVLDLGCGFGWFCRWARSQGAATVLGIDLSERMLARAAAETDDSGIIYRRADLEGLALPAAAFDLAYSSLALHYVVGLDELLATIARALEPGGTLVFSMEHPLYTAPTVPGFVTCQDGRRIWPLDAYLAEGSRTTNWLAPGVVKQHRTIGTMVTALLRHGFTLSHLVEWGPSAVQIAAHPEWADEVHRPAFLLVGARRG